MEALSRGERDDFRVAFCWDATQWLTVAVMGLSDGEHGVLLQATGEPCNVL